MENNSLPYAFSFDFEAISSHQQFQYKSGHSVMHDMPKLVVDDSSNAVCGQKSYHSHRQCVCVKSLQMAYPLPQLQSFPVVKVQTQEVKGGNHHLHKQGGEKLCIDQAGVLRKAKLVMDLLGEDMRQSEGRCHCNDVSQEEESERGCWEYFGLDSPEVLDVSLVFENTADSVGYEGHEEILNGNGDAWDDLGMVCEVIGGVCYRIHEVHPSKLVGGEELDR